MTKTEVVREKLRTVKVFNAYEFYGTHPFVGRGSGPLTLTWWGVTARGQDLHDGNPVAWYGRRDTLTFTTFARGMRGARADAMEWAGKRFGIKAWKRDPFGSYGEADYVTRRTKDLLAKVKP